MPNKSKTTITVAPETHYEIRRLATGDETFRSHWHGRFAAITRPVKSVQIKRFIEVNEGLRQAKASVVVIHEKGRIFALLLSITYSSALFRPQHIPYLFRNV